nr:Ig VH E4.15 [Mus musculus]
MNFGLSLIFLGANFK